MQKLTQKDSYRYERKMFITAMSVQEVRLMVRTHPNLFRRAYPTRRVNSIYFDTQDYNFLADSVEGFADRIKFRIRWYGDTFRSVNDAKLEIKRKKGLVGSKEHYSVSSFTISDDGSLLSVKDAIKNTELPFNILAELLSLQPVILNSYEREYFIDAKNQFRITLDTNMSSYEAFAKYAGLTNYISDATSVVLECKYDRQHDGEVQKIFSKFPMRITKSSKFVTAFEKRYML